MKQLPNPKPGEAIMRVQMDTEEMTRLLKPVFEEVNNLRKRVAQLEEDSLGHFGVIAELEIKLSRMDDDGR